MFRLLFSFFLCLLLLPESARAETIVVSPNGPLRSIKQAIEQAQPGDRVLIKKGVYTEGEIQIKKQLTIEGEDFPVLDGQNKSQLLTVLANGVTVKGLHLRNTGRSSLSEPSGVMLVNASNATVTGNRLENCYFGIYLSRTQNSTVSGNTIYSDETMPENDRGNGVHMWKSSHILVENNYITGQRDGIYLEFTTHSEMRHNLSEKNVRYGLHFMFSDNDKYAQNIFRNNGAGVAVMYTHTVHMEGNIFEQNWGSGSYGLLLKDISRSTIKNNTFSKNTIGLYMEGSSKLNIEENQFQENGWAVKLLANCAEDTFLRNNFMNNTFDVSTNGFLTLNHLEQNYWDKYQGYDLNKDRLGDIPYRPVSLYSVVVERVPYAIMFLRSFIVDLMDKMEKVIPSFTPELLQDLSPALARHPNAGAGEIPALKTPALAAKKSTLPAEEIAQPLATNLFLAVWEKFRQLV